MTTLPEHDSPTAPNPSRAASVTSEPSGTGKRAALRLSTSAWQLLRELLTPYHRQILFALTALILTAGITLSIGQGVRLLIDEGLATDSTVQLQRYVALFLAMVLGLAGGTFARYYWVSWIGERVVADLRTRVFSHLLDLHPGFFESNRSLEIQSRLTADTTLLQSVIGSSVSVALRNLIMLVGGLVWLWITNAKLTAVVLLSVPLVVAPILVFGRRVRRLSRSSQDRVADVGAYVGEILGQIKTVQAYNHQDIDRRQFAAHVESAFDTAKDRIIQRGLLITVVITLVLGAIGGMLWIGGTDVIRGEISGGELAAFVFYSVIVGGAAGSISEVIGELQRAAGAMERISELLAAHTEIRLPARSDIPNTYKARGDLVLDKVNYAYPSRPDQPAIQNLSLAIQPGETVALVGPSGAGKSTLIDLLLRFADPQSGQIKLDGHPLADWMPAQLRRQFALVSQHPALFVGSVAYNLRYGAPEASVEAVHRAARNANAEEFILRLPQGYDTQLGDNGQGLSGGQRQRLAIARALLTDAPVLLLDEATSALDAESERLIQDALERLMQGRTTLVIAHRLATVKSADRIAVIDEGQLIATGTHESLMISCELYARLARLQFDMQA